MTSADDRSRPLGVGIVGCGMAAQALHLPALASLPHLFRVVHVVDAAPSVATGIAGRYGARSSRRPADLFSDPDVEVVLVATPDAFHARYAIDACRAGKKAVLVEKPLALTEGEARAVVDEVEATGVPVQVGTMHRYDPAFRRAEQLIAGLDPPDLVVVETFAGPNEEFVADAVELLRGPVDPQLSDAETPLSWLATGIHHAGLDAPSDHLIAALMGLTLSTHDLALLRATLGEPEAVEHLTLLHGFGFETVLDYGHTKAVLVAYERSVKRVDWRIRWFWPDREVELRFPQSWGASEAASVAVHANDGSTLRSETFGAVHETGFRAEWRHLHAVATGGEKTLTPAADAAADVALVHRIVAAGASPPPTRPDATGVAVLGAGWITALHVPVLDALPESRVAVVASRTAAAAERRAWSVRADHSTFADLDAVVRRPDVDAVLVAGPPAVHAEHAVAALEAGRPVVVEKPLAATLAGADAIVETARRNRLPVAYAENYAHAPLIVEARRLVGSGSVGDVRSVSVFMHHARPAYGSFLDPSYGGGVLFDLGAHAVWWALALAGPAPVVDVRAELEASDAGESDDRAVVAMRTDGGPDVAVEVSWRRAVGEAEESGALVEGDAARLEVVLDPWPALRRVRGDVTTELSWDDPAAGTTGGVVGHYGYAPELRAFLDALRAGRAPEPDAAVGRSVLEVICAAYASAARSEAVGLPFQGPRDRTPYELWRGGGRAASVAKTG